MALDITIIDCNDLPRDVLPVPLEIYGTIFSIVKADEKKFPFLMRMKDYYKDADYNPYELPLLINEIRKLRNIISDEEPEYYQETLKFLNDFESLCLESINKNFAISAIAD